MKNSPELNKLEPLSPLLALLDSQELLFVTTDSSDAAGARPSITNRVS